MKNSKTQKIVKRFNKNLRRKAIDRVKAEIEQARDESQINELKEKELKKSKLEY